jgi:hypothetical protein
MEPEGQVSITTKAGQIILLITMQNRQWRLLLDQRSAVQLVLGLREAIRSIRAEDEETADLYIDGNG